MQADKSLGKTHMQEDTHRASTSIHTDTHSGRHTCRHTLRQTHTQTDMHAYALNQTQPTLTAHWDRVKNVFCSEIFSN